MATARRRRNPLPPLPVAEYAALRASIASHGVLVAVVVSSGPACRGEVADGHHRLRACEELGLECPRERRRFRSEPELRVFQLASNLARRQLTVAQRIRLGVELEPWERKLARERRAQAKQRPRGEKARPVALPEEKGETRARVAAAVGLRASTYERGAKVLREGSPELVAALEEGRESVNGAYRRLLAERRNAEKRQLARKLNSAPPPLPRRRFEVVVCDPPWPYSGGDLPYPSMRLEQIAELPIPTLLTGDSVLWLWTTNAFLPHAFELGRGWGLAYRSTLTWAKQRCGTGSWLRGQTEHCLLFSHGKPVLTLTTQSTLLVAPAREHSRKPDEFYALIASLCPGGAGWSCSRASGGAAGQAGAPKPTASTRAGRKPCERRQGRAAPALAPARAAARARGSGAGRGARAPTDPQRWRRGRWIVGPGRARRVATRQRPKEPLNADRDLQPDLHRRGAPAALARGASRPAGRLLRQPRRLADRPPLRGPDDRHRAGTARPARRARRCPRRPLRPALGLPS
jgi:N6-adenosine-specific RNA methylase IME4/ParB-like chromosome segregation protein Spo0J